MSKRGVFVFFLLSTFSFSQDVEWELWSKMEYRYKVNKQATISFEPGSRYSFSPILFSRQFLDFSSTYKIKKSVSLESGFRFTKNPDQELLGQRIYVTIFYKPDFDKYSFSWRMRFSSEKNVVSYHRQYFRNKVSLGYRFSDFFQPYLESEYLYGINSVTKNKFRVGFGNQFKFSKSVSLKIFYRLQDRQQRVLGIYISKKV